MEGTAAYQGDIYGFQVGPGELKAHLANGVLRADSLEVPCNQGRVALQAELRMDRQPMELSPLGRHAGPPDPTRPGRLPFGLEVCCPGVGLGHAVAGPVFHRVGWLPHPDRRFEPGRNRGADDRPFGHGEPRAAGPAVGFAAGHSPALVRIQPESVIQFRMTGGRIYHQGLALEFPDVTMRTYGSVGLDESLKLMVETSVPLKWLPSNAVTDAIKNQKMQIPVGGTLKSPRLDLAELARVKNQVLGNLTRAVLRSELGNQLNRFLQPQR